MILKFHRLFLGSHWFAIARINRLSNYPINVAVSPKLLNQLVWSLLCCHGLSNTAGSMVWMNEDASRLLGVGVGIPPVVDRSFVTRVTCSGEPGRFRNLLVLAPGSLRPVHLWSIAFHMKGRNRKMAGYSGYSPGRSTME